VASYKNKQASVKEVAKDALSFNNSGKNTLNPPSCMNSGGNKFIIHPKISGALAGA